MEHTSEFTEKGLNLLERATHGLCGETRALDEFLFEAEKILEIEKGTMAMEQAQKVLFNTISHARALKSSAHKSALHNTFKKACDSCNPMLKSFNIKEFKIR